LVDEAFRHTRCRSAPIRWAPSDLPDRRLRRVAATGTTLTAYKLNGSGDLRFASFKFQIICAELNLRQIDLA
jgi:hypothetical protein